MVVEQNDTPTENPPEDNSENAENDIRSEVEEGDPGPGEEVAFSPDSEKDADEVEMLRQRITVLEQRVSESTDKMLRAQAELDNVRKRSSRDIENAHKYALDKFLTELLPVLDSIELGINHAGNAEDVTGLVEGMDLTLKKFSDVLQKFGVSVIDPVGDKFNPEQHEAVSMQAREGVESGRVLTVMQKGYELNGRLIRPAMVIVSS